MINFIMSNLQAVLMGAALLAGGIYALTGFQRVTADDGETSVTYIEGRLKRNIAVAGILVALTASVALVPAGYSGVIYDVNGGVLPEALPTGVHLVVPFKQHVTNLDTRVKVFVYDAENKYVLTLDTQEIRVPIAINWRITDAPYVRQNVHGDPVKTITEIALLGELRNIIGKYELEKVAEFQRTINVQIEEALAPHFERLGLGVDFVTVLDVIPQRGIIAAIEAEKVAERGKITAEHNRDIAETNADAVIKTATGDATAIAILAKARQQEQALLGLTSTEYVWYTKWDGVLPITLLGSNGQFIVNLPAE